MKTDQDPQDQSKKSDQSAKMHEIPSLWVEGHLRITDPETKKELVNTRA